jgi:uracil-DNA glycosylase
LGSRLTPETEAVVRARIGYYRDLGIFDFYRRDCASSADSASSAGLRVAEANAVANQETIAAGEAETVEVPLKTRAAVLPVMDAPASPVAPADKAAALAAIRDDIGDCKRCALHRGRKTIVFGDGDANARLMFVGEGPGADEDAQGLPFVGRAGQLLNNMIAAMGLRREQVYIANIVKCRPPQNRVPEPEEANTCAPFLFRQIEVIRPEVIVALGSTAATYLLGAKSPLSALRGRIHHARGVKLIVTYHPAYLLRDPNQKKAAWADLQIAMAELGLAKQARND